MSSEWRRLSKVAPIYFVIAVKTVVAWVLSTYVTTAISDSFSGLLSSPWLLVQFTTIAFTGAMYVYRTAADTNERVLTIIMELEFLVTKQLFSRDGLNETLKRVADNCTVQRRGDDPKQIVGNGDHAIVAVVGTNTEACVEQGRSDDDDNAELLGEDEPSCRCRRPFRGARPWIWPWLCIARCIEFLPSWITSTTTDGSDTFTVWMQQATARSRFPLHLVECATWSLCPLDVIQGFQAYESSMERELENVVVGSATAPLTGQQLADARVRFLRRFRKLRIVMYRDGDAHIEGFIGLVLVCYFIYMPVYYVVTFGLAGVLPVALSTFLILTPFSLSRALRHPLSNLTKADQLAIAGRVFVGELSFLKTVISIVSFGCVFPRYRPIFVV